MKIRARRVVDHIHERSNSLRLRRSSGVDFMRIRCRIDEERAAQHPVRITLTPPRDAPRLCKGVQPRGRLRRNHQDVRCRIRCENAVYLTLRHHAAANNDNAPSRQINIQRIQQGTPSHRKYEYCSYSHIIPQKPTKKKSRRHKLRSL